MSASRLFCNPIETLRPFPAPSYRYTCSRVYVSHLYTPGYLCKFQYSANRVCAFFYWMIGKGKNNSRDRKGCTVQRAAESWISSRCSCRVYERLLAAPASSSSCVLGSLKVLSKAPENTRDSTPDQELSSGDRGCDEHDQPRTRTLVNSSARMFVLVRTSNYAKPCYLSLILEVRPPCL